MQDKTDLNPLIDVIIDAFKKKYGDYYYIGDYEDADEVTTLPAILIQLTSFDGVDNRIPDIFRADCLFSAYICENYKQKPKRRVRDTALDVAEFVDGNYWGDLNTFTKASFEIGEEDEFNNKIDAAEIWRVDWRQQIYKERTN